MSKKIKNKGEFKVIITSKIPYLNKGKFLSIDYMYNNDEHQKWLFNSTTFNDRNTAQKAASFYQKMWNETTKNQDQYRVITLFEANKIHLKSMIKIAEKDVVVFKKQLSDLIDEEKKHREHELLKQEIAERKF